MREIDVNEVKSTVEVIIKEIAFSYPKDILNNLKAAQKKESKIGQEVIDILIENEKIARSKRIPLCQDTGMVVVYLNVGQEIHFVNGSLTDAINEGVRNAYRDNYLRYSVVLDPLFERKNTKDNTPAVIFTNIVPGSNLEIEIALKGFGSENMSRNKMCKPAEGVAGIKDFIVETCKLAGPNACPPIVVGVGIGGTFEKSAYLAKKALFRSVDSFNPDLRYAQLEEECLKLINQLNIGPAGLKGKTTALKVNIEYFPTHIASIPVSVNISCHATRHKKVVL